MDFGKLFFSAYGRIGRQHFWVGWLLLLAASILLSMIPFVNFIAWFVIVYCGICLRSKRLHDMGRTGWWQVVPIVANTAVCILALYFIIAAVIAGTIGGFSDAFAAIGIVASIGTVVVSACAAWLIEIAFLIWIGVAERDPYDNIYGPGPSDFDTRLALTS